MVAMLANPLLKVRVIGLAAIIFLVIVPAGSIAKMPRFEGTQLVRYVLETKRFAGFSTYRRKVIAGTLIYGNEYRNPHDPPGPSPVDCARTGRIGLTFMLTRKTKSYPETVTVYFVWTHSNIKLGEPIEKQNFRRFFEDKQDGMTVSSGLTLTDEMRVDGTVSVRVKVGRHNVVDNSFSLSRCTPAN